ncbi:hypothetical protein THRCLA_05180, partial [Thraustotheca clavata]
MLKACLSWFLVAFVAQVTAMGVCYDVYDFKNIDKHFKTLHERFSTVRTFQTYIWSDSRNVIDAASDNGLGVYAGVWIRDGMDFNKEIQAVIDGYKRHPNTVRAVFVGNEDLDNGWGQQQIADKVNEARRRLRAAGVNVRVGSVQTDGGWLRAPGLADSCDIIGVNIYSFFGGTLQDRWGAMVKKFGNNKMMLTETGWPFGGGNYGGNSANYDNAVKYFYQVLDWIHAGNGGEEVMYFMFHDNLGKSPDYEKQFGLADSNGNWKFNFGNNPGPAPSPNPNPNPSPSPAPGPAPGPSGKCGAPEWNVDYAGNDMFNFGMSGDMGSLMNQCCNKCLTTNVAMGACYDTYDSKDIDHHFSILKQRFATVRTFQTALPGTSRNVIDAASDAGLGIYTGVWIRGSNFDAEVQAVIDGYNRHPNAVRAVFIGNEDLDNGWNLQQVADKVNTARSRLRAAGINVRVGSVQTDGAWLRTPDLANSCDIMGVNIYSFFGGSFTDRWNAMVARFGKSKLMITETGWPFGGGSYGGNVASFDNAVNYFNYIANWVKQGNGGEDTMYFMFFDNPNKSPDYEKQFGLADSNANWKFSFTAPSPGPAPGPAPTSCSAPEWNTNYPGNDLFSFGITGDMGSLIDQCCKRCLATKGCAGWVIGNNVCWIKSAMKNGRSENGATAAHYRRIYQSFQFLMKSYLKYAPSASFGVVASPNAPCIYDLTGQLAIAGALKQVIVWNIRTGMQVRVLESDSENDMAGQVTALCLSPDGAYVAVGYSAGVVRIFKLSNGNVEVSLDGHKNAIECLAYGDDGAVLASGSRDTDIIVWDVVSQSGLYRLRGHKDAVTSVAFVDKILISTSKDSLMKVWDRDTQHCVQTCVQHRNEVWSMDMHKRRVLTGATDNLLRVWNINESDEDDRLTLLGTIQRATNDRASQVHYNNHGTLLGCQGAGKTIEIFKIRSAEEQKKKQQRKLKRAREKARKKDEPIVAEEIEEDTNPIANEVELLCTIRCSAKVRSFCFSPDIAKDGTTSVLVSLHNNSLETYAITPTAESMESRFAKVHSLTLPGHRSDVRQVSISSDDQLVLSVSSATVKVWNARSMQCVRTLTDFSLALAAVFAPGNMHVIVGTKNGELLLFELSSGDCIWKKEDAHGGAIWSIDVRPDGKGIATGGADHMVNFWEFEMAPSPSGALKLSLSHLRMLKMSDDVLCVRFSHSSDPHKLLIAVALLDCTVKVFYDDSLKFFLSLYGHKLPVMAMDISTDDSLLVTASADKNVKLWGLDFGDCHKSIFAHDEAIMGICFVPKTHYFFTCAKDKSVAYWDGDHFERILKLDNNHFGEVWAIAVARDGSFVISASQDRSLVKYERSEDQVFIEEEKEKELEAMFESDINPTNTKAPTLDGANTVNEAESTAASKKTVQTVKSGERLIEAIDLAEHELKQDSKAQPNILLLGYSPLKFVLRSLREIRSQDLEEALLVLPFDYVQKLIKFLLQLIAAELEVELCCNSVLFLVKVHHNQIVANTSLLGELDTLWNSLRQNLLANKNRIAMGACYDTYNARDIDRHFSILRQRFTSVRTFQTSLPGTSRNVIDAASDHGLGIYSGVWIRGSDFDREVQAVIDGYKRHPNAVRAVFIGNEDLDNGWGQQQVADKVNEARRRLRAAGIKVRVGSVQTDGGWLRNPGLANSCDILGVNIYSFFGGNFEDRWNAMVGRFGKSKLMITETGWPFGGGSYGGNVASFDNAVNYFRYIRDWVQRGKGGEDTMYFMFHDNPGKSPDFEKQFGLADSNANWKFNFDAPGPAPAPAPQGQCSAPEWNTNYPGNDMFSFRVDGDMASLINQCCGKCLATPGCKGKYTIEWSVYQQALIIVKMVFFVCEGCNETLKKNKVDQHAARCRNCWAVTCVDCSVVFKGNDYAAHTTCISEAEKYQGALYQGEKGKTTAKRNPQERWMDMIQSATSTDSKVNQALQRIQSYDNVPRKKGKFMNFLKNSIGAQGPGVEERLWTFLETEFNKLKEPTESSTTGEKRKAEEVADEPTKKAKVEENEGLSALASHVKSYLASQDPKETKETLVDLTSEEKKWLKVIKSIVKKADGQRMGKKALRKATLASIEEIYPDFDASKATFKTILKKSSHLLDRDGDYYVLKQDYYKLLMAERVRVDSADEASPKYVDSPNVWVWCPDEASVCVPGAVVGVGKDANTLIIHTEDGEERQLDVDDALPVCMDLSTRVSDVAELFLDRQDTGDKNELNERLFSNLAARNESQAQALEHSLLYTLRTRYRDERIYTECGASVLLNVNPKRPLPLYTPDRLRAYRHRQTQHELPPHIFGLAEDAMSALHDSGDDQAIVLLGESGSGKSEAAKLILQYLCYHEHSRSGGVRSKSKSVASEGSSNSLNGAVPTVHIPVEEQILHAVAVLEAFGHCCLPHNANASRFVKLISVDYDTHGRLLACNITAYGLEKARVVQTKERNFHMMHYLLAEASMNPTLADILDLPNTVFATESPFAFAPGPINRYEASKYHDVVSSLAALRVPSHHIQNMMKVLAVILHLGNVTFVPAVSNPTENSSDASCVILESSSESLTKAAALLEVEASVLDHYFRTRKMVSSNNQSSLKIVSVNQAMRARDTFCKNLYEALFNAIVYRMNASLRSKVERYEKSNIMVENRAIHILDGFGFETVVDSASSNSVLEDTLMLINVQGFESLNAHYWSEKTRAYYLSRVFQSATATAQHLDPYKYVRVYEASPAGIYQILNEHMSSKAKQSHDAHFVNKLLVANEAVGNTLLQPVLPSPSNKKNYKLQFLVHHSAGSIIYEADDIARRNNKSVSTTAAAILKSSKNSFVKGLVDRHGNSPQMSTSVSSNHVRVAVNFSAIKQNQPDTNSVATDLVQQSTALFDGLADMGQHFVVCLNPSPTTLQTQELDARYVLRQIRSFQILALMHATQRSLTVPMTPQHFFTRYRHICGHRNTLESLIRSLTAIGVMEDLTWRLESNQVWLTLLQRKKLEKARELYLNACATMIQRNLQRGVYHLLCIRRLESLRALRKAMETRDRAGIQQGLTVARSWIDPDAGVRVITAAQALLSQVEEEFYLTSILTDAVALDYKVVLQFATHTVQTISPTWKHDLLKKSQGMLRQKNAIDQSIIALRQTMLASTVDTTRLMTLLSEQEGRMTDERQLATLLMIHALEAKKVRKNILETLPNSTNPSAEDWHSGIVKAIEMGLVKEVVAMMKESFDAWSCLREEAPVDRTAVENVLKKAIASESVTAIETCMEILNDMGTNGDPEYAQLAAEANTILSKIILKPSQERSQAIELIELAIESDNALLLSAAIKRCRTVGMASWDANVKKATQALGKIGKESNSYEEGWKLFVEEDFDGLRDMAKSDPGLRTSTIFTFINASDEYNAKVDAVANAPLESQLDLAAQLGILFSYSQVALNYFNDLDSTRKVENVKQAILFIKKRLNEAEEVRPDMLSFLTSQVQLISGLDSWSTARSVLDDAAVVTKRLQRTLNAKSKLEKLLKSASINVRTLEKVIQEAKDVNVDGTLLTAASEVLQKLTASDIATTEGANENQDEETLVDIASYDKLRSNVEENRIPFTWEYRALDFPILVDSPTHLSLYINRCILGYMRDRMVSFREMLAQSLLQVGIEQTHFVDEILMQIIKQLINNPRRESLRRGWDLLAICLTCFRPSSSLQKYVISFVSKCIRPAEDDDGAPLDQRLMIMKTQGVAQYCKTRLEGDEEATGFLPSLDELLSFEVRSPFVATIELLDGTVLTNNFPVSPELTITSVVQVCAHFLGLSEQVARVLGLAIITDEEPGSTWCHPLVYLSDIFYNPTLHRRHTAKKLRFVLKVRMIPPMFKVDDDLFNRLLYLQAMDDIVTSSTLPFQHSEPLVRLAVYAMLIDTYPDFTPTTEEELLDMNVYDYLPPNWHVEKTEEEWGELLWQQMTLVTGSHSIAEWQSKFMEEVRKHRLYGCHFYKVDRSPAALSPSVFDIIGAPTCIVGINGNGVHFMKEDNVVLSWEHSDLASYGGKGTNITIQTTQLSLSGISEKADEIRQLLGDYALWQTTNSVSRMDYL